MAEYLAELSAHFNFPAAAAAKEWRALMEPTVQGALDRRPTDQRVQDIRFVESLIDSLML